MITGALEGGVSYILTSVPQIPATSIFIKALSFRMSGIGNSRISILPGPTRTAAKTFSIAWFPPPRARIHHEGHQRNECKPDAKRKRDSAQPQERAQPSRYDNGKGDHSRAMRDEARRQKNRRRCRLGFPDCANCRSRGCGNRFGGRLRWH